MNMDNFPLLSVIVPCYNVEKYLDKCISSLVGQTYSNLEILLVDDGSADETGALCDIWQTRDKRIRVVHKQNEGSSYARKTGVENATAEYVTFVDSDDWISPNMYADMMSVLLSTNSDIAECDLCFVNEEGHIRHRIKEHDASIKIIEHIEGVCGILKNHWRMSFNTKIFKKKLFDNVEFLKIGYGDDVIVYRLYHHASQIVYLDSEYYFYNQRSGSLCTNKNVQDELKKISEWSDAFYECYDFVENHKEYHSVLKTVKLHTMCAGMRLLHCILTYPKQFAREAFSIKAKQLLSIPLVKGDLIPRNAKNEMYLLKISPVLFKIYRQLYHHVIQFANQLKITNRRSCKFINDSSFFWRANKSIKEKFTKLLFKVIRKNIL